MTVPARVLIVGIGPHARTFYLPAFRELEAAGAVMVAGLVDIEPERGFLDGWLAERSYGWPRRFLPAFSGIMPEDCEASLDAFVAETGADAVVISTDPLSHKCYALWAIRRGLHVLLDKPVTTAVDAVTDLEAAEGIERDYEQIATARATSGQDRAFILCAHRRFHPGFDLALSLVAEASARTGCPVTNLHHYHSDGQWRLPEEILRQGHHSYHHGHGKLSHSGFHFLDMLYRFRKAGRVFGKEPDAVEIHSAFLQPDGFLQQLNRDDYRRLFGEDYDPAAPTMDGELADRFQRFGEMDAECQFRFLREGRCLALASASLLHGGFSRRAWLRPGDDLYKGNGRVKHEQHRVHVGPFFGIQIHSCQAKDNHEQSGPGDEAIGGNNHFEIWVFRNVGFLGGEPFEKITFRDLPAAAGYSSEKLFIEQVKRGAIDEFLDSIAGRLPMGKARSDLNDHRMPVRLLSGLYRSHGNRIRSGNPVITVPWEEE